MTEKEAKQVIRKRIENVSGCPFENFALALENCIRISGKRNAVTITDWDAEHLLIILKELEG